MADPIPYARSAPAPGVDAFTPEDDVARLVRTLHDSGTLRAVNGLLAQFAEVNAVLLEQLDTEEGRNGLSNVLILLRGLGHVDSDGTDRFVKALTAGLGAAGERLKKNDDPPNMLKLAAKLREPEVRRGLDAMLTLVGTLGKELAQPDS